MGQQEVYDFLKKHRNKWLPAKEIAKKLKISSCSTINSLQRLGKGKSVNFKIEKGIGNREIGVYKFKE